jgi:hypothetical protein
VQTEFLLEAGLVRPSERERYDASRGKLKERYHSRGVQGVILALTFAIAILARTILAHSAGASSWERLPAAEGGGITAAGWWSMLVCLPIPVFLLLRWLWRVGVWSWFLVGVSRLDLELTPTHPDHCGGLAFLTWGQASFAPVLAAVSTVLSGSLSAEVLYAGASINSLKYHVAVFVVLALALLLAPLLVFARKMARCRFNALLDFTMLALHHDRAFDRKWIESPGPHQEGVLGSSDVLSLAALAKVYEDVAHMKIMPLDHHALLILILAAAVPLVPFLATSIPLIDIIKDLGEFLV